MMMDAKPYKLLDWVGCTTITYRVIDTGIVPNDADYKFVAEFMITNSSIPNDFGYFSNWQDTATSCWQAAKPGSGFGNIKVCAYAKSPNATLITDTGSSTLNRKITLVLARPTSSVNGVESTTNPSIIAGPSSATMKLGGGIRWTRFATYHNGELIQDLRSGRDRKGQLCMVDILSGTIFNSEYLNEGSDEL